MNQPPLSRLIWAAAFFASAGPLEAKLNFPASAIVLKAEPGQEILRGEFPFTNAGSRPVTILELKPSCGCTVPVLEKKTYAPGESGTIGALFTIGERVGPQSKEIAVRTDENPDGLYELTFSADIPPYLALDPRLLLWDRGAPKSPKTVAIVYPKDAAFRLTAVKDASGAFLAQEVPAPDGTVSEVRIAPVSTDTPLLATMMFTFTGPNARTLQRSVFLRVLTDKR